MAQTKKRLREVALKLSESMTEVDALLDDLREEYDEMSERVQEGKRGDALQDLIERIESANADIESAHSAIEDELQ